MDKAIKSKEAVAAGRAQALSLEGAKRFAGKLANAFSWVAVGTLILMMPLTSTDVLVRSVPGGAPIPGAYEIAGFLGSVVVAFAIAYTQMLGGHIAIDWIVGRFPSRLQAVTKCLTSLAGAGLFVLASWESCLFALGLMQNGEVSPTQKIPFYPFVFGVAISCVPVALLLILDFFKAAGEAVRK
jgi:TRAP-type C4-dicarboxylate transport system permease small subunit